MVARPCWLRVTWYVRSCKLKLSNEIYYNICAQGPEDASELDESCLTPRAVIACSIFTHSSDENIGELIEVQSSTSYAMIAGARPYLDRYPTLILLRLVKHMNSKVPRA